MSHSQGNQEQFLNNIAGRLGRPRKSGVIPPVWDSRPYTHLYEGKSHEDLILEFIANLKLLNTEVDRIPRDEFNQTMGKILGKWGIKSAIFWDDALLHDLQLSSMLASHHVEHTKWNQEQQAHQLRETAAKADLGITSADMGLAETGTVVLFNGGGRGRMVSLLPPAYLCILQESKIVPRLTQAVEHVHSLVPQGLPACINFITGPSRTGDIEMDLAFGVHGPGKVHIILLAE
jgi:L-lactate dehydrogenase complex protein LldG